MFKKNFGTNMCLQAEKTWFLFIVLSSFECFSFWSVCFVKLCLTKWFEMDWMGVKWRGELDYKRNSHILQMLCFTHVADHVTCLKYFSFIFLLIFTIVTLLTCVFWTEKLKHFIKLWNLKRKTEEGGETHFAPAPFQYILFDGEIEPFSSNSGL